MAACEICDRDTPPNQRTCIRCHTRTANDLTAILTYATAAHGHTWLTLPSRNPDAGHSGKPGSRPPLNVDTIDPHNAVTPNGHTILNILEDWAITIRHARQLTPYGIASLAATLNGKPPLTTLITFHQTHLAWTLHESPIQIATYTSDIANCARTLKHWDTTSTADATYRISCPADTTTGQCKAPITLTRYDIADNTLTHCKARHEWTARRLLAVANASDTEIWLTAEDIAHHLGLHERTIRKWARAGHIRKHGDRYSWTDAKQYIGNHEEATA